MTPFNEAGAAAVQGNRSRLARALRAARSGPEVLDPRYGKMRSPREYARDCRYHASFVGWPSRVRPSGSYR